MEGSCTLKIGKSPALNFQKRIFKIYLYFQFKSKGMAQNFLLGAALYCYRLITMDVVVVSFVSSQRFLTLVSQL